MSNEITVLPRLVVAGADAAIDFYQRAFGAELTARHTAPDGSVVNAELMIGQSRVTLKDEDGTDCSVTTLGGSPVLFLLVVPDADAVADAAVAAGARVIFPVADMPYGYRQGRVEDPFGLQWMVSQDIEELGPEQTQARLDEMLG